MVIINAIYFKGIWLAQFNEYFTSPRSFWTSSQDEIKVDTMSLNRTSFRYTSTSNSQVLEMPYEGDRFSMIIVLPNDIDGIKDVEDSLTGESFEQWRNKMIYISIDEVYIPKFKLKTDYDLKSSLQKLGIVDAFDEYEANFSKLSNTPNLFIAKVTQDAFVAVDEEGTEAAAVTVVGIGFESLQMPNTIFRADHPFLFVIWDDETESILFMGRIVDPTA